MLDLPPEWLESVRRLIASILPQAEVLAFGSRVRGSGHEASDLDLVARDPHDPRRPQENIDRLRAALSESDLPILVDVHDWARIPESFREEIVRGGTVKVYPPSCSK